MRTCPQCRRTYADDIDFCSRDGTALARVVTPTEAELAAGLARRYRIIRRLGAGGMGTVFLAEQIAVGNRPVALKVLLRKLLDDPEFLIRFHNEAASTGKIRHANVVTIYESGQAEDGTPYIAMEYLEGETLRQALKARGAIPMQEVAEIIQQVARGLNAAHKLGIVHRDLKPDNIFLTAGDEGELVGKVVDFGIAKLRESAVHTLTGAVLGTPAYMSFEQAAGMRSEELDARSDVYSLGIVAYEMLTGRVPFHSDTPLGLVRKHLTEEPPPFRVVRPDLRVPPQLERVVMTALVKEREQRYSSALEFSREFGEAIKASLQETVPVTPRVAGEARKANAESHKLGPAPAVGAGAAEPGAKAPSHAEDQIVPIQSSPRPGVPPPAARPRALPGPSKPTSEKAPRLYVAPPATRTLRVFIALLIIMTLAGGIWYLFYSRAQQKNQQAAQPTAATNPPASPAGMIYIPGGTFMMGRDNAEDVEQTPAHSVTVAAFFLDKIPVTNAQYAEFVRAASYPAPPNWNGSSYPAGQDQSPVTNVSWEDARAYCGWNGKRLPAEAEWEYAARGTDDRLYPWGNDFKASLANSEEFGLGRREPVAIRPQNASPFGVLDMSGNVWQWCEDEYKRYLGNLPTFQIPPGAKVIRGGSFQSDKDHVTTTTRNLELPTKRSPTIGFRCAK